MSIFPTILGLAIVAGIVGGVMIQGSDSGTTPYLIGLVLVAGSALAAQYAIAGLAARQALREHQAGTA